VRAHPTTPAAQVQQNLALNVRAVYVFLSKHSSVMRIAKQVRETVFAKLARAERINEIAANRGHGLAARHFSRQSLMSIIGLEASAYSFMILPA
jgi:hypothetical protein